MNRLLACAVVLGLVSSLSAADSLSGVPGSAPSTTPSPASTPSASASQAPVSAASAVRRDDANTLQSIQISQEKGVKPDEIVTSWFFIFKDKPSSYFYELKQKEKRLVFEFNDTRKGLPVAQTVQPPISHFDVEQRVININKDIRGLKAEYHNQIRVTFALDNIPAVLVNDQSNVIVFSYKWTTNPAKVGDYVLKSDKKSVTPYLIGGAAAAAVGVGAVLLTHKSNGNTPDQPLDMEGLPSHPAIH